MEECHSILMLEFRTVARSSRSKAVLPSIQGPVHTKESKMIGQSEERAVSSRKRKLDTEEVQEENKKTKVKVLKPWKVNPDNDEGLKVAKPKAVNKANGMKVTDHIIGKGALPKPGATLKIVYECLSPDGEVFDSVLKKKDALKFRKGLRQVVEGLDLGVDGMRIGGAREIFVPANLG